MPRTPQYNSYEPTSPESSRVKRANRKEGGKAERMLRSILWRRGLRFRVHPNNLPGKPDMVFRGAKLCVFVDGDFWHGRDWPHLRTKLQNRANPSYWIPKIARNRERDEEQEKQLRQLGWTVFRLWETDILKDPDGAADQVMAVLEETRGMLNAST